LPNRPDPRRLRHGRRATHRTASECWDCPRPCRQRSPCDLHDCHWPAPATRAGSPPAAGFSVSYPSNYHTTRSLPVDRAGGPSAGSGAAAPGARRTTGILTPGPAVRIKPANRPALTRSGSLAGSRAHPMKIRFWGTRGSVPTPGPRTARFGGNTSCVEVRADDGTCLVIDCGTGAREMGAHLLAEHAQPPDIHLLIGH